jgi:hypothetical protein
VSERLRGSSEDDLANAVRALQDRLAWPDANAVPAAVVRRIQTSDVASIPSRLSLPSRRRTLVILVAAILALAGIAVAARLVIDLGAITIDTGPGAPVSVPTGSIDRATFGAPVGLQRASEIAGFSPHLPVGLGGPDLVWAERAAVSFDEQRTTAIVMAWRAQPGFPAIDGTQWGAVLMEFRGQADIATKTLIEGHARLSSALVNGHAAYVITGEHELDLLTNSGMRRFTSDAVAVLWNEGEIAVRLETGLGRDGALAIASRIPG